MSTFTARLNLELPEPSESMALGDNILSANYTKIDAAMGSTVDSGEPGAPYEGQIWSARDVGLTTRFFHEGWNIIGSQPYQRGFRAYDLDATTRQSTNNFIDIMSVTFNAVAGRSYLIDWATFYKWSQPARGFISYWFYHVPTSNYIKEQRFDWYAGATKNFGQAISAFWIYDETVTREVELIMQLDTSDGGGLTAEIGTAGAGTSCLVTDWGET